jgi:mono/diheme cytochrome c family protein
MDMAQFARLVMCAAVAAFSSATSAQVKSDFDAAALFKSSCAPCHGLKGSGDGPMAEALTSTIKPLSGLAARHGGVFPFGYVYRIIEGRQEVKAHGSRLMPVWGTNFGVDYQADGSMKGSEAATEQKIDALVEYLRMLQPK